MNNKGREACVSCTYFESHIANRATAVKGTLRRIASVLVQKRCDASAHDFVFPTSASGVTTVVDYLHSRTLQAVLSELDAVPDAAETVAINSHYGRTDKLADFNWHIEIQNKRNWDHETTEAFMQRVRTDWHLAVSTRLAPNLPTRDKRESWVRGILAGVTDRYSPAYSFMSVMHADDSHGVAAFCGGMYWTSVKPELRRIDDKWWDPSTDRLRHVRGVYWGNYFGPILVALLHERGDILTRFDAWQPTLADGTRGRSGHPKIEYLSNGGAFLRLTGDILDDSPSIGMWSEGHRVEWAVQLRDWLTTELRTHKFLLW
jgi:hypothetical protein